jgi:hypothetical protein
MIKSGPSTGPDGSIAQTTRYVVWSHLIRKSYIAITVFASPPTANTMPISAPLAVPIEPHARSARRRSGGHQPRRLRASLPPLALGLGRFGELQPFCAQRSQSLRRHGWLD